MVIDKDIVISGTWFMLSDGNSIIMDITEDTIKND